MGVFSCCCSLFFFKQKTAYEMRISDWSSDVCSSDLDPARAEAAWKFVNFMAGKPYTVAKRWAVEKGLGFGQLPLFEDKDVIAAWSKWADVGALGKQASIAKAGPYTEFSSVWSAYFRPLLAQAMVGEAPVDPVM